MIIILEGKYYPLFEETHIDLNIKKEDIENNPEGYENIKDYLLKNFSKETSSNILEFEKSVLVRGKIKGNYCDNIDEFFPVEKKHITEKTHYNTKIFLNIKTLKDLKKYLILLKRKKNSNQLVYSMKDLKMKTNY